MVKAKIFDLIYQKEHLKQLFIINIETSETGGRTGSQKFTTGEN